MNIFQLWDRILGRRDVDQMTLFYLVRHGATALNNDVNVSQDKIRGWLDPPLVEAGREHAAETGKKLRSKGIQIIISSDLKRAKETAEIVGKEIGVKPIFSRKLRPWDLGELTGQSTKKAIPKIAEYVKEPDVIIPKGESFNSFLLRAFAGLADAFDQAGDKKLCIVTHHRLERLIKAWLAAGQPADHSKIDLTVFKSKGEPPGTAEPISLDPSKLRAIRKEPVRGAIERAIREAH